MRTNTTRLFFLAALCAALAVLPDARSRSSNLTFSIQLSPDRVRVQSAPDGTASVDVSPAAGETYARFSVEDTPALPYRVVQVLLPNGTEVDRVDADVVSSRTVATGFRPALAEGDDVPGAPRAKATPPVASPGADVFPDRDARYLGTGVWNGRAIASFAVFPLRTRGDELHLSTQIDVTLRTVPARGERTTTRALRMSRSDARNADAALAGTVVNPEAIATYPPLPAVDARSGPFQPTIAPSLEGSPVEYVIITTDALAASYQRLADRRTAEGMPTVIRTVEWIASNYKHGSDIQETVRTFIQDAYAKWGAKYILLGGDTAEIPTRFLYTTYYYGGKYIASDLYYEGLDGTWNDNHDAEFGEVLVDAPDLYSEVYVNRLPTSTPADVAMMIDKIESYESPATTAFTDKALFLAEVLFPTPWSPGDPVQGDGAAIAELVISSHIGLAPLQITRLYERDTFYPGALPESRAAAVDSMNAGYNHVIHIGHGFRFNMHCADENVAIPDVDNLTNDHQFSNVFMLNCSANAFDFDCLGEHFLKNPNGGAVTSVGSSNSAFATVASYYTYDYYNLLFQQNVVRVGELHARARFARAPIALLADNADLWTQYIFAALADPTMQMWTGPVDELTVTHPDTIGVGPTSVAVHVSAGGSPCDSATVCLLKDGEDYQTLVTDALGDANFSIACETPGSISVVARGFNKARHQSTIYVTGATGPYLAFDSVTVDDDMSGGTVGNGDGIIDAGETVDLVPHIANTGDAASAAVTLTLSSASPHVSIGDATASIAPIAAGTTQAAADPWRITVASAAPDEAVASFDVHMTGGGTWDDTFARLLHAPDLAFALLRVDDSAPLGDGNGFITSGEQFRLYCSVKNYGSGTAYGLTSAIADASGGGVTIFEALDTYPDLGHLDEAENVAGYRLSEVSSLVENNIVISITDAFGRAVQDTVELRAPTAPTNLLFDASLGGDRIGVTWDPSASTDVDRYHVFHSTTPGGPYTRATTDAVVHTTYTDIGLAPSTRYYFVVTSMDRSGNESAPSVEVSVSTNPQQAPGWPNELTDPSSNSPILGDIDGDGNLEVVVGNDYLYAWHHDGQEIRDGDGEALTYGVFSDQGGGFIGPVALAKLDGDFGLDIVAASWSTYEVYCFNYNGNVLPGWPQPTVDRVRASMVVADLDGDGSPEIIAMDQNGWMYAWNVDGSEYRDGDNNPATQGIFYKFPNTPWWQYQSPAAADVDNDNSDELIVATQDSSLYVLNGDGSAVAGWPRKLDDFAGGGPVVGDIDNDGSLDIIVATKNAGQLTAFTANNVIKWTRWLPVNLFFNPTPALADLDDDGKLETLYPSSNGKLYALKFNGSDFPGWPVTYGSTTESSPIVADIDGDGSLDVILGDETQFINAWDAGGNLIDGFPLVMKDAMRGTPSIADMDRDGDLEIVAAGYDRTVYMWDLTAPFQPGKAPWPMLKGDWHRSALYGFVVPTAVARDGDVPSDRATLMQNYPNPFNPTTAIVYTIPAGGASQRVSLTVYDVTGARVRTLVDGAVGPGRHTVEWNGVNDNGARVGSGVYFYRLTAKGFAETRKMVLLK